MMAKESVQTAVRKPGMSYSDSSRRYYEFDVGRKARAHYDGLPVDSIVAAIVGISA